MTTATTQPVAPIWRNRIVGHGEAIVAEIVRNPRNWRTHPIEQLRPLLASIREVGFVRSITINRTTGNLVDGHGRVLLAERDAVPTLPVEYVELTESEEALILATLDPLAGLAGTDAPAFNALLGEIHTTDPDLMAMLSASAEAFSLIPSDERPSEPLPDGDDDTAAELADLAEQLREKWQTAPGQLWLIPSTSNPGREHRLLCGDSTTPTDVDRLMKGETAQICWTDPPWNVAYGESNHPAYRSRTIANDNLGAEFPEFCRGFVEQIRRVLVPGAHLYLAMSAQEWPTIHAALTNRDFHWSSTIIWAKQSLVLSRKDYHTQYEPIWYGWLEGAARLSPLEDRSQSDLWHFDRPGQSPEHPTMKPVGLVARALLNSSIPGDIAFEPFSGSGTTLVAGEETGRIVYALELEPKYIAVALERLSRLGLTPQLAGAESSAAKAEAATAKNDE